MKSQLASFTEKGKIPVLDFLSAALESAEYERALARAVVSRGERTSIIKFTYVWVVSACEHCLWSMWMNTNIGNLLETLLPPMCKFVSEVCRIFRKSMNCENRLFMHYRRFHREFSLFCFCLHRKCLSAVLCRATSCFWKNWKKLWPPIRWIYH